MWVYFIYTRTFAAIQNISNRKQWLFAKMNVETKNETQDEMIPRQKGIIDCMSMQWAVVERTLIGLMINAMNEHLTLADRLLADCCNNIVKRIIS